MHIFVFVDLICSRLGQLENQHGYAELELMGLNVAEFRHTVVADCYFSADSKITLADSETSGHVRWTETAAGLVQTCISLHPRIA